MSVGLMASGAKLPQPIVYPSGAALAIILVPITPPAPALFSTTTGWPSFSVSLRASRRIRVSE